MDCAEGNFTIPGEAGYEQLTLHLAEKWGADVIRDSDGTQLSDEIIHAGYGVYSTVCPIRDHNAWLIEHPQMQQQAILVTMPMLAEESEITISLLKDFFSGQFRVNDSEKSQTYWQVFDRTTVYTVWKSGTDILFPSSHIEYGKKSPCITI